MASPSRIRYKVRYSGRVQGVGFRMTAISQADGLDVHGSVKNEIDGSVLLDVEGPPRHVKELLGRIQTAMQHNIDDAVTDEAEPRDRDNGLHIAY